MVSDTEIPSNALLRTVLVVVALVTAALVLVAIGFQLGRANANRTASDTDLAPSAAATRPTAAPSPPPPALPLSGVHESSTHRESCKPTLPELRAGLRRKAQSGIDNSEVLQTYVISTLEVVQLSLDDPNQQDYHRRAFRAGYDYQGVVSLLAPSGHDQTLMYLHKQGAPVDTWEFHQSF